jgi:cephalosporin-C deacetylase-like acetyl esterase
MQAVSEDKPLLFKSAIIITAVHKIWSTKRNQMEYVAMKNFSSYVKENQLLHSYRPKLRYGMDESFDAWQKRAYEKLWDLLGLSHFQKCSDELAIEWEKETEDCLDIRFTFQSEENYYVPCRLLIPKGAKEPIKTVLCIQGHSTGMHISMGEPKYEGDAETIKGGDRDFARRAVKEGYAAVSMEQRYMGECGGNENGPSCGREAMTALLLGRCAIGERVWDVMRLIDVLENHFSCLDKDNIMCLGNSGGGTTTYYAACIDKRIRCAVPSCAVCT